MKAIIFDASSLISIAMNCLLPELVELKKTFKGKFIITDQVEEEIIKKPLTIKRFELEALRLKQLLDTGILEKPSSLGINNQEILNQTNKIMQTANRTFISFRKPNKPVKIIHLGEASCLALSKTLNEKNMHNLLCIDERTTRILVEKPENLKNLLEKKINAKIRTEGEDFKHFTGFKVIRSTELMYIAYKKGIIKIKGERVLEAMLYALKFKGCSISEEEIRQIRKLK